MESHVMLGRSSSVYGGAVVIWPHRRCLVYCIPRRLSWFPPPAVVAASTIDGDQNHYDVLGLSPAASRADIKRAYRLLALKYHPDVTKESRTDEAFKSIRVAYDVLSNDATRTQYDQSLKCQGYDDRPFRGNWNFEAGVRINRWADLKQKMQHDRYWEHFNVAEDSSSFHSNTSDMPEKDNLDEERSPFIEVLTSAFLSLFLMQTVGCRLSLIFSSLMALADGKLDMGYKFGYVTAWLLGGRGGILLTLCLSFASWVCGKTSSGAVALVVVAMWFGSNLAKYVLLPKGALLTLLYMSIKLHEDFK